MRFNLPSFTLTVRDLTDEEWSRQIDRSRDYYAVEINARCGRGKRAAITLVIGSGAIRVVGSVWNETAAARSAISFASAPHSADDDTERAWMEAHGEDLSNEASCHRTLGTEMRRGC